MKKIISLILTLNLLLLCMPCGYAAFTDVENSIAIDTVVGLGLMEVNADGAFMPDENLTRGEFAQIIAKIYTYGEEDNSVALWKENFFEGVFEENKFISPEDMEKTKAGIEGMFEDVLTSNDYYDAITLVATKGIMVGKGGKYFDPDGNVTVEQALKVLDTIMGYGYMAETMGGYPNGFSDVAAQLGLTKNVVVSANYATRADIATILYNALDVELMQLMYNGEKGWFYDTVEDDTFLTKFLNIGSCIGRMTNNSYTNLLEPLDDIKDYVVINNKAYRIKDRDKYVKDYIGREVKVYYYIDNDDNDEFVFANLTGKDEAVSFDISSFISYENNKISYFNERDIEKSISVKQAPFVIMNGSAKENIKAEDFLFNYGTVTVVKPAKQGEADLIILKSMVNFNINYFDVQGKIAYSIDSVIDSEIDLSNEDDNMDIRVYNALGELKDASILANGTITTVSKGEKRIEIYVSEKEEKNFTISSVDTNSNDEIVISDGKIKYIISKDYTDATGFIPRMGNVYDMKIDILGNVVDLKAVNTEYQIGFLNNVKHYDDEETSEEVVALKIYDMTRGKLDTIYIAQKIKIIDTEDNVKVYKIPEQANIVFNMLDDYIYELIDGERTRTGALLRYKLDDDGFVSYIELAGVWENSSNDSERLVQIKIDKSKERSTNWLGYTIGGQAILNRNTRILQCNYQSESFDEDNGYLIGDINSLTENKEYDIKLYSLVKNSPVVAYAINTVDATRTITTKSPHTCGIVTNIETALNDDDEVVSNITMNVKLSTVEYETKEGLLSEGNVKNVQGESFYTDGKGNKHYFKVEVGDIIRYGFDMDGKIDQIQLLYDANADYSDGVLLDRNVYEGWSKKGNLAGCIAGFDSVNYKYSNPYSVSSESGKNVFSSKSKTWSIYSNYDMRVLLGSVLRTGSGYLVTTTQNMSESSGKDEGDIYTSNLYSITSATVVNVNKRHVTVSSVPITQLRTYEICRSDCDRVIITARCGEALNCIVYRYDD